MVRVAWLYVGDVARLRGVSEATIRSYVAEALARPLSGRIPAPERGLRTPGSTRLVMRWRPEVIGPWLAAGRRVGGRPVKDPGPTG